MYDSILEEKPSDSCYNPATCLEGGPVQNHGSGGVAFVSIGLPAILLILMLLGAVAFGIWWLVKLFWAAG
jgi:hypothetical protein